MVRSLNTVTPAVEVLRKKILQFPSQNHSFINIYCRLAIGTKEPVPTCHLEIFATILEN
jgi:hypothetical protein